MGHFPATNPFGRSDGMNVCSLPNCTVVEEAYAQLTRQSAVIASQAEVIEAQRKYVLSLETVCDYSRTTYWAERHFRMWVSRHGRRNKIARDQWVDLRDKRAGLKYALKCMASARAKLEEVRHE